MTGAPVHSLPSYAARARFGFFLMVIGGFWTVVGLCITLFPSAKASPGAGVFNALMAIALLLGPGLYLWLSARATQARNAKIERIAALASVETRMPLGDAATTLGVGIDEVRVLILDAVNAGLLTGHIDSEKNVFVAGTSEHAVETREVVCSGCGGHSTVVIRSDETPRCGYCGAAATPVVS